MSAMCSLPLLYLLIPDLFYGNATWYDTWLQDACMIKSCPSTTSIPCVVCCASLAKEYHSWGKMRNITDVLVVVIKFHPFCDRPSLDTGLQSVCADDLQ